MREFTSLDSDGELRTFPISPAVPAHKMLANMRSALALGLPEATICKPHGLTMSIAGGGPSLADTYKGLDGFICAVNGSLKWLLDHDPIEGATYACGIMDAGEHISDMIVAHPDVRYYVASICDPSVFDKLKDCDVRLWHVTPNSMEDPEGAEAILDEHYPFQWVAIGGGCTMGLRWIDLGYFLGFRKFKLHGLDSSFRASTHAYPDRADDKQWIEYNGRKTRLNFLCQVHDFAELLERLWTQDRSIEIEVFGDGLLQDEWKLFKEANPDAFTGLTPASLYVWPEGCRHREYIAAECYSLAENLLPYLNRRDVAVQAGGNVGILPQILSGIFGKVHTFEPDAQNFACLVQNASAPNITAYQFALGDKNGEVAIAHRDDNCGQSHVVDGDDVPVVSIDAMELAACDLIALDVEGYELAALKGAAETIAKFSPVIAIEENGLSERYGVQKGAALDWLVDNFGYGVVGLHGRDLILTRQ